MLNVYSCGCTARNVPVLSRCETHNGYVVVVTNGDVPRSSRASRKSKDGRMVILYDSLLGGMGRLRDSSVGLVFTYPDHFPFAARDSVETQAFQDFPDLYFPECRRVLKDDGHVVLIVEHNILSSVVYCGVKAGFKVNSVSTVRMKIKDEPFSQDFLNSFYVYKACVVLSPRKSESRLKVGNVELRNAQKLAEKFHTSGLILDTSCIHYPFVFASKKIAKTVGIVSDNARYKSLIKRMENLP